MPQFPRSIFGNSPRMKGYPPPLRCPDLLELNLIRPILVDVVVATTDTLGTTKPSNARDPVFA